jgi:hypothetical protein
MRSPFRYKIHLRQPLFIRLGTLADCQPVKHDAVLDYYGRRLATCSSDKTIKIFEIEGDKHHLQETLKGYEIVTNSRNRGLTLT